MWLSLTDEPYMTLKSDRDPANRKGDTSCETSPVRSDLLKIWFDFQITA